MAWSEAAVHDVQADVAADWVAEAVRNGRQYLESQCVPQRDGGRHVFTLKRPAENLLSCEEHETDITDRDQMHAAIVAMGFRPTVRIVKMRRTGAYRDMLLCVDELSELGWFLEVERMVSGDVPGEAVQAELCRFVESLGVAVERTEQTYDWLVRHACAAMSAG
jgi:adenylate cyclase, class 2